MTKKRRLAPEWPGIIEERDDLIVLAKPAGLDVFPAARGRSASLWGWLAAHRPALAEVGMPGEPAIVHRLDRGTSGLVLAATTRQSYQRLRSAMSDGTCAKDYLALVEGSIEAEFEVDLSLGARHRRSRKVLPALPGHSLRGVRPARTRVRPLDRAGGKTLCQVRITTGVRHQIRAHLANAGHPIAGDRLYGAGPWQDNPDSWFFLHAWSLQLASASGDPIRRFVCPLPRERAACLKRSGFEVPAEPGPG